ncbi:hypothetical protein G7075_18375 [Phycicoccus sp. HDW14]|uniref:AMIN-like domain-containing (lipo)protein n=1 Tax=Phycicoccus sp. HDW14 TaxID=2714941 RepID=UPI0014076234|nr:hypothetical protein [Phycicoccus sp. HDW14]QIM22645.1 hypothetical protein G7075_18375 [Phycicoccus sp. HDW14]
MTARSSAPTPVRRTRRVARGGAAATAALAVVALAACTTSGKEEPGLGPDPSVSSSSASPSATPDPSTSSASPSPSTTLAGFSLEEQKTAGWPELGSSIGIGVESRVGKHTGYDRVVYQFSKAGTPTYRVRWVDAPVEDGSGDRRDVPGDAWLEVMVTSVDIPGESAPSPDDPLPATLKGTGIASADAIWGGFEGYGQQFIGVTGGQRPFRVSLLTGPTRLVVDVAR